MKKSDYPTSIRKAHEYTAGDIAIAFGVAHRTACKLIDTGQLPGHRVPGGKERRVRHEDLMKFVSSNPSYSYILARIEETK